MSFKSSKPAVFQIQKDAHKKDIYKKTGVVLGERTLKIYDL